MPFQVYEQGRGIATPWYDIFPARSVQKTPATEGPLQLSPRDQLKESDHRADQDRPRVSRRDQGQSQTSSNSTLRQFQSVEDGVPQRQPVFNAGQIMSAPVQTVLASLSVRELWQQFSRHQFRHFPVVDGRGMLVGIVSDRDALGATSSLVENSDRGEPLSSDLLSSHTVARVMKSQVLTASPETNLRHLAEVMLTHHIGAMPLMANHQLVGIVTRTDILRTLTHQVPINLWS